MSMYEIRGLKGTSESGRFVLLCRIRLNGRYEREHMFLWFRRVNGMFKVEIKDAPYKMESEELDLILDDIFEHILTKSKYRVQAVAEGWKEQGYIIESIDYDWGWDE